MEETGTRVGDTCIHTKTADRTHNKTRKKIRHQICRRGNFKDLFGFSFQ